MLVGLVLAMTAAACGGAGETSDSDRTSDETDLTNGQPSPEISTPQSDELDTDGVEPGTTTTTLPPVLETLPPVTAPAAEIGTTLPPPTSTAPPPVHHPNPLVATALGDLVNRISVDPAAIEVVSIEEVTWSDGSLGCPQPDMSYTQALVNGTRIILRVSGVDYEYHSGGRRAPFYCKNPIDPVEGDYGDV
jgi:hypothetical protein